MLTKTGKVVFGTLGAIIVLGVGIVVKDNFISKPTFHAKNKQEQGVIIRLNEAYQKLFNVNQKTNFESLAEGLYIKKLITKTYLSTAQNSGWSILTQKYGVLEEKSPSFTVKSLNLQKTNGIEQANLVVDRTLTLYTKSQTLIANQELYFNLWLENSHWMINSSKVLKSVKPS